MGEVRAQVNQGGRQPAGEERFVCRPGPGLSQAGALTSLVPRGLAARFSAWREFFDQLAEMPVRDAAEGRTGHGRAGLLGLSSFKNPRGRRRVTA
ncbi:hypothetical protein [Streptomyces sp. CB02400]|uniref:hypothetical protein n=1 Tax=Streptomyces sp. CB02400 TaxID=1703944 RepID=UPI0011614DD2|nr:hypothetical protein [Streptomyces sp. CB02400]